MDIAGWYHPDALVGVWEIRYPGTDGLINDSYVELLELRGDGTFAWNPPPLWVKPDGRWGVTGTEGTSELKLHFEERRGKTFRGNWLVLTNLRVGEREERAIHWQRTQSGAVVFDDRIFAGRAVRKTQPAVSTTDTARYPHLIVRIMATVYQHQSIQIRVGTPKVEVVNGHCAVQHPAPFAADGTVGTACRALLIAGVQTAVRAVGLRMCIVWAPKDCTYVEANSIHEFAEPPSGGVRTVNFEFQPQRYEPL